MAIFQIECRVISRVIRLFVRLLCNKSIYIHFLLDFTLGSYFTEIKRNSGETSMLTYITKNHYIETLKAFFVYILKSI